MLDSGLVYSFSLPVFLKQFHVGLLDIPICDRSLLILLACCCRTRGFATYTLIVQVIAMFFALCVIAFDSLYIEEPTTCFFSSSQCNSAGTARGLLYSTDNFNNIKMTAIKIQLGAGCFMWLICLIYIVVYIITTIRVYRAERPSNIYPQGKPPYPTFPDTSKGVLSAPPMNSYVPPIIVPHNAPGTINVVCPTCSAAMSVTATKRPPMY